MLRAILFSVRSTMGGGGSVSDGRGSKGNGATGSDSLVFLAPEVGEVAVGKDEPSSGIALGDVGVFIEVSFERWWRRGEMGRRRKEERRVVVGN